jgi:hypothetical protein
MRLNQIPVEPGGSAGPPGVLPPGGGRPDLASSPAEKRAAAKALEDSIEPGTRAAGDWADTETEKAVGALQGWLTSGALKKAHTTWGEQVTNLMNRLSSEKAALRGTGTLLQGTDLTTGANLRAPSALDGY